MALHFFTSKDENLASVKSVANFHWFLGRFRLDLSLGKTVLENISFCAVVLRAVQVHMHYAFFSPAY